MNDLRFAFRQLLKSPGFTAVAVLMLALGIGATSTVFSLMNGLFFRPLPGVKDLGRLVSLDSIWEGRVGALDVSYADFLDFRTLTNVFADMAAVGRASEAVFADIRDHPQPVQVDLVTGNYFDVLGVEAMLGRNLLPMESQERGAHPVALLNYEFWRRHLDSAADAVGRTIKLNGHFYTVVGVAPEQFQGDSLNNPPDLWIPLAMVDQIQPRFQRERLDLLTTRGIDWLRVRAKLFPGVSLERAKAAVTVRERQTVCDLGDDPTEPGHVIKPFGGDYNTVDAGYFQTMGIPLVRGRNFDQHDQAGPLVVIINETTVVGMYGLLLAAIGLYGVTSYAVNQRTKEFGIRMALGARRVDIFVEGLQCGTFVAAFGLAIGMFCTFVVAKILSALVQGISFLDASVHIAVLSLMTLVTLIACYLPARRAANVDPVVAQRHE